MRGRYGEHIGRFGGLWHARVHECLYDCIHIHVDAHIYIYRYIDIRPHVLTQTQRTRREDERTRQVQRCGYNALKRGAWSPKRTFFCMHKLFWNLRRRATLFPWTRQRRIIKRSLVCSRSRARCYACGQMPEQKNLNF